MEDNAVGLCGLGRGGGGLWLFLPGLLDRTSDIGAIDFGSARKVEGFLRPGPLGRLRLIVEHVTAFDHEPGYLQHGETKDRGQDNRDDANVTKGFHAARPSDLLRSENA